MGFMEKMEEQLNGRKTLTENGAVAYETSGKKLLDFNFAVSAMRNMSVGEIIDEFTGVYYENPLLAIKYLFFLGDIRQGLGERKAFRACLQFLIDNKPEIAKAVLKLVPEYNRWDTVLLFLKSPNTESNAVAVIGDQLSSDLLNANNVKPVSLCAKWMPSINASSKETKRLGKKLCKALGLTEKEYRQMLSLLRHYLEVVEVKMSAKEWSEIDYSHVPSKANLIYSDAFLRNDEVRRRAYLESLVRGETKINAGVLNPHEICAKYHGRSLWYVEMKGYDQTLEELWKALPNKHLSNTLVVRDGSGSMTGTVCGRATGLDVATALAVYMAERNTGEWKDKFITFSARPKLVDLANCDTLRDKLALSYMEADCSNTDIYQTMKLVLNTAVKNHMTQDEMPEMIIIVSDMQFDPWGFNFDSSLFDRISDEYKDHDYELPRICFWNLDNSRNKTVPMQENENGLILCSGFSVQVMNMFMSNEVDPYKVLLEMINSERYAPVEEAVKKLVS